MDSIMETLSGLFSTLVSYLQQLAKSLGLDGYLDAILGAIGIGGGDESEQ